MEKNNSLQIEIKPYSEETYKAEYDYDRIIYDLDSQIDLLSSQADKFDYLVSIASGLLCGLLDILWVGDFSLEKGREIATDKVDNFVLKTSKMVGYKGDSLQGAVKHLEKKYPIPSDGNTPEFGGGLQHHLRDFAHHPTITGLIFSLLTQFTNKSYGTDVNGVFMVINVPEISKQFIGKDVPSKIINGSITWFFHLVSDMAGSNSTVGLSGGTGIPGPLLSLAKEISTIPIFKNLKINDNSLSTFLSKLFNGTLLAKHDESGKIIRDTAVKFDLRSELGVSIELGKQAIPVIANECIVRVFYFIRRLAAEIRGKNVRSLAESKKIDWNKVKPFNNPTISRMLTISTGVFTTVDIGGAIASQNFWLSINYVGLGRFVMAVGVDVSWGLKSRNIKLIKQMYEKIQQNTFTKSANDIYKKIGENMENNRFGLTMVQTEILFNLEYYKTLNDIQLTKMPVNNEGIKGLKQEWLNEWRKYISQGFSSFLQIEGVEMQWYTEKELIQKIEENDPKDTWFRLVLLEAMLFEPYYALSLEKDKKGKDVPTKKYAQLHIPLFGYSKSRGDAFLESYFTGNYYQKGYIKRLRKCYDKVVFEMKEVLKSVLIGGAITVGILVTAVVTAGAFAPSIAVALVGSNFVGLSGAALTSASLAYLGGGAIAAGGAGMAGGIMAIVGGGAALGVGAGLGIGGAVGISGLIGKKNTILQSAKLLVSVREIFLNDEHDLEYSNSVYEQYVQNIMVFEKAVAELKLKADVADGKEKKELKANIKNAEDSIKAMKIARKNLLKFKSSFEEALS